MDEMVGRATGSQKAMVPKFWKSTNTASVEGKCATAAEKKSALCSKFHINSYVIPSQTSRPSKSFQSNVAETRRRLGLTSATPLMLRGFACAWGICNG